MTDEPIHAPDCDGFAMHFLRSRQVSSEGRGMWQAECSYCGLLPGRTGRDQDPRDLHRDHPGSAPCEGRCVA